MAPGAGISSTAAAGGSTAITTSGTLYADASYHPNAIGGLTLSNDSTSPNSVLDIAAGAATDSTNTYLIKIAAFTKSTAGAWASGSGSNGMGNGLTIAASTWYHVCLAYNGGTPDIWFDTSATCANKPSGISGSNYRRIGSFKTDSSSHILAFTQFGDDFVWSATVSDFNTSAPTSVTAETLSVPSGVKVWARFRATFDTAGLQSVLFYSPDQSTQTLNSPTGNVSLTTDSSINMAGDYMVRTNTSGQIEVIASAAGSLAIATYGWVDRRGRL